MFKDDIEMKNMEKLQEFDVELQGLFSKYSALPIWLLTFVLNKELYNLYRTAEIQYKKN